MSSFSKTDENEISEYKNRGMFCGWPNERSDDWLAQRLKLSELPFHYVRKYHGYAFSWAVIYTFWYHPMENTYGQGSIALYYSFYDQVIFFTTV